MIIFDILKNYSFTLMPLKFRHQLTDHIYRSTYHRQVKY